MAEDAKVSEAGELYREAIEAQSAQRRQIEEDLRFSDPSNPDQWDADEKLQRENDPGGSRPCLVLDQLGQYVANVAGQTEQRPPSLHALPAGDGADIKVAEKLDGFFRHIEHVSRAQAHYARVLTSSARAGVGYIIVRPEYTDRALGYQEPRISSEGDPLRVVLDPWSVEIDGSDASYGFLLTPMSHKEFERRWPKRDKVNFGDDERKAVDDQRNSILVAEQWYSQDDDVIKVPVRFADGREEALTEEDLAIAIQNGEQLQPGEPYKDRVRRVWWRKLSGCDILEESVGRDGKPAPYPADHIGIVPCYGYVGWDQGRMTYCGIPRRARNAQRAYNYHQSEMRAYMGQAPKSPWIVPARAVRGLEALWDRSSVESRGWLPYHDVDETGQPIAQPQRMPLGINLQNHIQGAQQALLDIQASIGMYQANLGAPSNETSGVAIDSRKAQGEASTAHFPAHLGASIGQVGRIVMQMIPRLIDTTRQLRILNIDQSPSQVRVDPRQPQAMLETEQGISINPCVGRYDVRAVVGSSFITQRQQAQQAYTEIIRANPALTPAIAPLWAQTLDVPHADKLAQVLTAVAPEPVKAILQPDQTESTAELKAKLDQMGQALQEAIQHARDAQAEADEAQQANADKQMAAETAAREAEARERELAIKAYDAETKRLQVVGAGQEQMAAIAAQVYQDMARTEIVEGEGPDGSARHEGMEGEQPDPMETTAGNMQAQPSAEIQQLLQGHQQLAQHVAGLTQALQSQQADKHSEQMAAILQALSTPRERIPVRDKAGDIIKVIERPHSPTVQ